MRTVYKVTFPKVDSLTVTKNGRIACKVFTNTYILLQSTSLMEEENVIQLKINYEEEVDTVKLGGRD